MKRRSRSFRPRGGERESGATAIEFVWWTPFLFLVMFTGVQAGLDLFVQHVAISAAQEGARTAREEAFVNAGWQGASEKTAKDWVDQLVGGLVADPGWQPQAIGSPAGPNPTVGVTVSFAIVSVVPGWHLSANATSQGPVECFYDQNGYCGAQQ